MSKYLLAYPTIGVIAYFWMLKDVTEEVFHEDLNLARLMLVPWAIFLWPVEFGRSLYLLYKSLRKPQPQKD